MTAHSSGTGTSWNETLDVDQPHGLDFQEWNDIRIGIRKRESQEHAIYADNTIGGIHKPGGSAILAINDGTPGAADGTYRGHGLVWDNSSRLWCSTAVAGATASGDQTVVLLHPDKQWGGQDITWTGAHEFDASIDISGNVTIEGALRLDGSADFSDVFVEGDISVKGVLKVDGTATQFGGTEGIGLFYDPTAYTGGETATIGNGLILKVGDASSIAANTAVDISYATPFPNGVISTIVSGVNGASNFEAAFASNDVSTKGFLLLNSGADAKDAQWISIGH